MVRYALSRENRGLKARCEEIAVVARDEPCGDLEDGGHAFCDYGLSCKIVSMSAEGTLGACKPVAEDGASCSAGWLR